MIIGIDPDLRKNGVAFTVDGKIHNLFSMGFYELTQLIDEHKDTAKFVLEKVDADKATYARSGVKNKKVEQNIAQKVGMVKGMYEAIRAYLEGVGADFRLVKPLRGTVKKGKDDAEFFNRLTGWKGQSNQDKRDAALLALYG